MDAYTEGKLEPVGFQKFAGLPLQCQGELSCQSGMIRARGDGSRDGEVTVSLRPDFHHPALVGQVIKALEYPIQQGDELRGFETAGPSAEIHKVRKYHGGGGHFVGDHFFAIPHPDKDFWRK